MKKCKISLAWFKTLNLLRVNNLNYKKMEEKRDLLDRRFILKCKINGLLGAEKIAKSEEDAWVLGQIRIDLEKELHELEWELEAIRISEEINKNK